MYDSPEALKKFEPHYRLVRVGVATKIEKPSRQQRTFISHVDLYHVLEFWVSSRDKIADNFPFRQATQEQTKDSARYGEGQGCCKEEGEIDDSPIGGMRWDGTWCCWYWETSVRIALVFLSSCRKY